jgi:hypothetical protein
MIRLANLPPLRALEALQNRPDSYKVLSSPASDPLATEPLPLEGIIAAAGVVMGPKAGWYQDRATGKRVFYAALGKWVDGPEGDKAAADALIASHNDTIVPLDKSGLRPAVLGAFAPAVLEVTRDALQQQQAWDSVEAPPLGGLFAVRNPNTDVVRTEFYLSTTFLKAAMLAAVRVKAQSSRFPLTLYQELPALGDSESHRDNVLRTMVSIIVKNMPGTEGITNGLGIPRREDPASDRRQVSRAKEV